MKDPDEWNRKAREAREAFSGLGNRKSDEELYKRWISKFGTPRTLRLPPRPRPDIQEWNAAVDARKALKKGSK